MRYHGQHRIHKFGVIRKNLVRGNIEGRGGVSFAFYVVKFAHGRKQARLELYAVGLGIKSVYEGLYVGNPLVGLSSLFRDLAYELRSLASEEKVRRAPLFLDFMSKGAYLDRKRGKVLHALHLLYLGMSVSYSLNGKINKSGYGKNKKKNEFVAHLEIVQKFHLARL